MYVAYLLPHPTDVFNLLEDGIQWMEKGKTSVDAESALRKLFRSTLHDDFYTDEQIDKIWDQHQLYIKYLP
jgi:hypothetical protein